MAVNGLTNVSAKRGTTAKVKWGKAKLAVKTGIFCGAPRPVKRATTALAVVAVVQFKPCLISQLALILNLRIPSYPPDCIGL